LIFILKMDKYSCKKKIGIASKPYWEPGELEGITENALKRRCAAYVTWAMAILGIEKYRVGHNA
jgi:hypothetical protein